jgi:hypothetical protein
VWPPFRFPALEGVAWSWQCGGQWRRLGDREDRRNATPNPAPGNYYFSHIMCHILKIKACRRDDVVFLDLVIIFVLGTRRSSMAAVWRGMFEFLGRALSHLVGRTNGLLTCNSLAAAWDWTRQIFVSMWLRLLAKICNAIKPSWFYACKYVLIKGYTFSL